MLRATLLAPPVGAALPQPNWSFIGLATTVSRWWDRDRWAFNPPGPSYGKCSERRLIVTGRHQPSSIVAARHRIWRTRICDALLFLFAEKSSRFC